jgi:hypothetical protein
LLDELGVAKKLGQFGLLANAFHAYLTHHPGLMLGGKSSVYSPRIFIDILYYLVGNGIPHDIFVKKDEQITAFLTECSQEKKAGDFNLATSDIKAVKGKWDVMTRLWKKYGL